MRSSRVKGVVAAAGVAASAFALATAPASAGSLDGTDVSIGEPAEAVFVLTLQPLSPATGEPEAEADEVTLTCFPAGGTHPAPERACEALAEVDGHFERLASDEPVICPDADAAPQVWNPVRAEAEGFWKERDVSYSEEFGNRCEAAAGTNNVYRF